jgi:hypothetical protein
VSHKNEGIPEIEMLPLKNVNLSFLAQKNQHQESANFSIFKQFTQIAA